MNRSKTSFGWLISNSKKILVSVTLLTIIGIALSFISVKFAVISMELLDSATGKNDTNLTDIVLKIIFLLIIQISLKAIYTLYDIRIRAKYKNHLQDKLFRTTLTREYIEISKFHSGELVNRLTNDINIIITNVIDTIPQVVSLIASIVFGFVAMYRIDSTLSCFCILLGPIIMATSILYGKKIKRVHKHCRQSDGLISSFMQECIQNIVAVKSFCGEDFSADQVNELQDNNYKLNMKRGYIRVFVNVLYFISITVAYYFSVAWCAYKIKSGLLTVGAFAAIVQLVSSIQTPFKNISGTITKFYAAFASIERIVEIEDLYSDCSDGQIEKNINTNEFKSLAVKNIKFSYGNESILNCANFELTRGEIAVIRGISGIGKSTFFKILLGLLSPESGEVTAMFNHSRIQLDSKTRNLFAYVPQGNMVLSGTIRKNITFPHTNISEEKIVDSAKKACAWDFISSLENGLDTEIGENGIGLSEGQIQRIAIARAFCCDAPILLFDEATSALDDTTELQILRNIKAMCDKSCIIITHRIVHKDIYDKEFYLNDGSFCGKL